MGTGRRRRPVSPGEMALSAIALNESHSPPPTSTSRRWLGSRAFCELRKRRAERVKDMHALSTMLDEYLTVSEGDPTLAQTLRQELRERMVELRLRVGDDDDSVATSVNV